VNSILDAFPCKVKTLILGRRAKVRNIHLSIIISFLIGLAVKEVGMAGFSDVEFGILLPFVLNLEKVLVVHSDSVGELCVGSLHNLGPLSLSNGVSPVTEECLASGPDDLVVVEEQDCWEKGV